MKPRILFIVPSDYDSLVRKGVEWLIRDRDEGGFFGRVVTVHAVTPRSRTIELDDTHVIHEFGWDRWPGAARSRVLRLAWAPFHLLRVVRRAGRLVESERIDIIRATDPYVAGLIAWCLSALYQGLPYCVSVHADYDKRFELDGPKGGPTILGSRKLAKILERFVLSRASLVMPIRESLGRYAVASGARAERNRIIPHGIDMTPFRTPPEIDVRARLDIGADDKIISFVGRLSRENYVDDIVALARRLVEYRDDFVVVMAGEGAEEDRLRAIFEADAALRERMLLLGFQPRKVALELRRASAVNLCLMGGLSLIEACASGAPTIAYDVEWHDELIEDGETGYLVPEGDIDALERAVIRLLDDPAEAGRMGTKARALAFSRHDLANASAMKRRCYEELLGWHHERSV